MFLVNSRQGSFAAAHFHFTLRQNYSGQSILQTYGRCIAEFLNEGSLDHLNALTSAYLCWFSVRTTIETNVRHFSGKHLPLQRLELALALSRTASSLPIKASTRICQSAPTTAARRISHMSWQLPIFRPVLQTLWPAQEFWPALHRLRVSASA